MQDRSARHQQMELQLYPISRQHSPAPSPPEDKSLGRLLQAQIRGLSPLAPPGARLAAATQQNAEDHADWLPAE
jgi:hypothetical protein